jgi:Mor family transcriptional regulator
MSIKSISKTFYGGLSEIIKSHLIANSINLDLAVCIAKSIINGIAVKLSGTAFYLHKGNYQDIEDNHTLIVTEFTCCNHSELIQKYRISKSWLIKLMSR